MGHHDCLSFLITECSILSDILVSIDNDGMDEILIFIPDNYSLVSLSWFLDIGSFCWESIFTIRIISTSPIKFPIFTIISDIEWGSRDGSSLWTICHNRCTRSSGKNRTREISDSCTLESFEKFTEDFHLFIRSKY